jgi:hypothetical protein
MFLLYSARITRFEILHGCDVLDGSRGNYFRDVNIKVVCAQEISK